MALTISTCNALSIRLVGASFAEAASETNHYFDGIVLEAVRLLNGEGLSKPEAEAQRETLIQGYRWILVDEYQDIGPEEYALIFAVAGRSLDDKELRLSLFRGAGRDKTSNPSTGASSGSPAQSQPDARPPPNYRS